MNDEIGKSNQIADCIICAAGASRRMGAWKLSLPWVRPDKLFVNSGVFSGITQGPMLQVHWSQENWLVDAAVCSALAAGCRVILVAGFRGEELEKHFACWPDVRVVRNERWEQGMVSSIKKGLPSVQSPWFFVAHADMPLIDPQWYKTIFTHRTFEHCSKEPIAIRPIYQRTSNYENCSESAKQETQPGHPVLFSQAAIPLIKAAPEGDSLKPVLHQCKVVTIDVADNSVMYDVDTLETYISTVAYLGKKSRQQVVQQAVVTKDVVPKAVSESAPGASSVQLITGTPGSGKTTLLRQNAFRSFINLMESSDSATSLFVMVSQVQTGRKHDGKALGFDLEAFYWTKETGPVFFRQPLCSLVDMPHSDLPSMVSCGSASSRKFHVSDPILLGPYQFDPKAFEHLAHWLGPALENHGPYRSIYVYMDELGKLELDQQQGLWTLFTQIMAYAQQIAAAGGSYELVFNVRKDRQKQLVSYVADHKFNTTLFDLSEH